MLYGLYKKCVTKPVESESTLQYKKKKVVYEHGSSEAWLPTYGLVNIKENAQSDHLQLQCRMLRF
jgi:hypothetical protein